MAADVSTPDDAAHASPSVGADVFISYSRADRDTVATLADGLRRRGRSCWVDWSGIPPTAEWMSEIRSGIDAASAVVFMLSPDAVASRVCGEELGYAVAQRKRIVPVVVRDVDAATVPPDLARLNWLVVDNDADPERLVDQLVEVLDTDLDAVRTHTRLTVRAAEWEASERDRGRLLRGADLEAAEHWLASPGSGPEPTSSQVAYVAASRRESARRQRSLLVAVAAALVVTLLLGVVAVTQRRTALEQSAAAQQQALVADAQRVGAVSRTVDDPALGVLLAAAGQRLDDSPETRDALLATLTEWDGLIGSYGWGSPITSIARGSDGGVWVSDGKHADLLRLDTAHPAASVRSLRLRYDARTLASDTSGRWLAASMPNGGDVSGTAVPVQHTLELADTSRLGPREKLIGQGPYADVWQFTSDVAPAVTADALVAVDEPRTLAYEPGTAALAPTRDPGEIPSGTKLRAYPLLDFARVAARFDRGTQPPEWVPAVRELHHAVRALAAVPGGGVLAAMSVGSSGRVVELDDRTLAVRRTWAVPVVPASVASLGRDGIVVGGVDGRLVIVGPTTRQTLTRAVHAGAVRVLAVSPDGRSIAAGSVDGRVTVHGLDGRLRFDFLPGAPVTGLLWDGSGRALVEADRGGTIRCYDVDPQRRLSPVLVTGLPQPWLGGTQVRASADGTTLAVVGRSSDTVSSGRLSVVDVATGSMTSAALRPRAAGVTTTPVSVALTGDGTGAIVATQEGLARYDRSAGGLAEQRTPAAARPPNNEVVDVSESVELSADGSAATYLAGGVDPDYGESDGGHPQVLGAVDPTTLARVGERLSPRGPLDPTDTTGPTYYGSVVAGSDPTHPLLTCGLGCFARADLASATVTAVTPKVDDATAELIINRSKVRVVAGGGDVVIEGSDGGLVRLFSGPALSPVGSWVVAHGGRVQSAAVSVDGALAATGGADSTAVLWDARSGRRIGLPIRVGVGGSDYVSVALVPGALLTVDTEGTARRTPATADAWVALACRKAGRDLTAAEWARFLPGRTQVPLCSPGSS